MANTRNLISFPLLWSLFLLPIFVRTDELREPLVYQLHEELRPGYPVGNILTDSDLSTSYTAADIRQMELRLLDNTERTSDFFRISPNGTLTTTRVIDRDVLCPVEELCFINLDIEITPIQFFQIVKVRVMLLDINDNVPAFEESVLHLSLSESTPVGSVIPLPMAYDADSPDHSVIEYKLRIQGEGTDATFGLQANGVLQDLLGEIYLEVLETLDREVTDQYLLEIRAIDGVDGDPTTHQATLFVNITLTDINDNMPEFSQSKYSVRVPENTNVNHVLLTVTATDQDNGDNNQLVYGLSSRTSQANRGIFRIDSRTGDIILNQAFDYERVQDYTLVVIATDRQTNGLTGEAVVSIEVTDVNDNSPQISVTSLGHDPSLIQTQENTPIRTPLAHISVTDPDLGAGGTVGCLLNDSRLILTQIYANDFMLQTAVVMDYEEQIFVDVGLTCVDGGHPERTSHSAIRLFITDVNDNAPKFTQDHYSVFLNTDLQQGDVIIQLSADDADSNANGDISYGILDPHLGELFEVDSVLGILSAKTGLPQYVLRDLQVPVVASDHGSPQLSHTTTVILSAVASACPTQATEGIWLLEVGENRPRNTPLTKVAVDSSSDGCQDIVDYRILPSDVASHFALDLNTGDLGTSAVLDREDQERYCATLIRFYRDCPNRQPSHDFRELVISVADMNDNVPRFVFPYNNNNTAYIGPGPTEGRVIAAISAADDDNGDNAKLSYFIHHPELYPFLTLDPDTGVLYFNADAPDQLDFTSVVVTVMDFGDPPLSSQSTLHIHWNTSLPVVPTSNDPIVAVDSLTLALSIAVPCGFVLVLTIVFIVLLVQRKVSCWRENTGQNDRNHINPSLDLKFKEAETAATKGQQQQQQHQQQKNLDPESVDMTIDGSTTQGLWLEKGVPMNMTAEHEIMRESIRRNNKQTRVSSPVPIYPSCQDSDSGCSTDMSNSTTDCWAAAQAHYTHHQLSDTKPKGAHDDSMSLSLPCVHDDCHNVHRPANYITDKQVLRYGHVMLDGIGGTQPVMRSTPDLPISITCPIHSRQASEASPCPTGDPGLTEMIQRSSRDHRGSAVYGSHHNRQPQDTREDQFRFGQHKDTLQRTHSYTQGPAKGGSTMQQYPLAEEDEDAASVAESNSRPYHPTPSNSTEPQTKPKKTVFYEALV